MNNVNETLIPKVGVITDIRIDTADIKTFRVVTPDGKKAFEKAIDAYSRSIGMKFGCGYITLEDGEFKGPIAKFLTEEQIAHLRKVGTLEAAEVFTANANANGDLELEIPLNGDSLVLVKVE